jgi:hypothetical protein
MHRRFGPLLGYYPAISTYGTWHRPAQAHMTCALNALRSNAARGALQSVQLRTTRRRLGAEKRLGGCRWPRPYCADPRPARTLGQQAFWWTLELFFFSKSF